MVVVAVDSGVSLGRALFSTVEVDLWRRWRWAATAAAAADDGGVFFLKPQRCVLLNKYSGGDGREEAPWGADCWEGREGALCQRAAPPSDGWRRRRAALAAAAAREYYFTRLLVRGTANS